MIGHGKVDKRMEAETASLLKHMLELELRELGKAVKADILMLFGVDGRIFSTRIPNDLNPVQYRFLSLIKANLPDMCSELARENLIFSIKRYEDGTLITSAVGPKTFVITIFDRTIEITDLDPILKRILMGSQVIRHLFEQRAMTEAALADYDDSVREELGKLSRKLFVERFEHTREYKRNIELEAWVRKKVAEVVNVGQVDEIMVLSFNEMGTKAPFMKKAQWRQLLENITQVHIKNAAGEIVSDEAYQRWLPELEQLLKRFL